MSSTRSASAWVARLSAAAPKSVTVLICPVRPKGRFSIMAYSFPMHVRATYAYTGRLPETTGQGQEQLTPWQVRQAVDRSAGASVDKSPQGSCVAPGGFRPGY